jgi:hypothetical protein
MTYPAECIGRTDQPTKGLKLTARLLLVLVALAAVGMTFSATASGDDELTEFENVSHLQSRRN